MIIKCSCQIDNYFFIGGKYVDRNEIIKCYCIKDSVFTKYIKARIIDDKNDYTNEDIREISLALSFEEIGFELKNIAFYLSL